MPRPLRLLNLVVVLLFVSTITAKGDGISILPTFTDATFASWRGVYVGGFLGGVAAANAIRLTPDGRWLQDSEAPFLAYRGSPTLQESAALGGVTLGYNHRIGRMVFGPEADIAAAVLSDTRRTGPFPPYVETGDVYRFGSAFRSDFLSTLRGRAGLLLNEKLLVFATGGLALADLTYSNGYGNNLGPGLVSVYTPLRSHGTGRSLNDGWTLGGGAEMAIAPRWTIKVECLYADLGSGVGFTSSERLFGMPQANGFFVHDRSTLTETIGKLGLNYSLH